MKLDDLDGSIPVGDEQDADSEGNEYTVVGVYPGKALEGYHGTYVESIHAETPVKAAQAVRRKLAEAQGLDADDFATLAVFEGRHNDVYEPSVDI